MKKSAFRIIMKLIMILTMILIMIITMILIMKIILAMMGELMHNKIMINFLEIIIKFKWKKVKNKKLIY